jgi:hypothetical protein
VTLLAVTSESGLLGCLRGEACRIFVVVAVWLLWVLVASEREVAVSTSVS